MSYVSSSTYAREWMSHIGKEKKRMCADKQTRKRHASVGVAMLETLATVALHVFVWRGSAFYMADDIYRTGSRAATTALFRLASVVFSTTPSAASASSGTGSGAGGGGDTTGPGASAITLPRRRPAISVPHLLYPPRERDTLESTTTLWDFVAS